jgi:hypothetical protein
MRARKLVLLGCAWLGVVGCRHDPSIALLERELRLQEDRIYQLQDRIEDYEAALAQCRRENTKLRGETDGCDSTGRPLPRIAPAPPPRVPGDKAPHRPPGADTAAPGTTTPPKIDYGERLQPGEVPPLFQPRPAPRKTEPIPPSTRDLPRSDTEKTLDHSPAGPRLPGLAAEDHNVSLRRSVNPPVAARSPGVPNPPVVAGHSRQVVELVLNRRGTGGTRQQGEHAPGGLKVLVEPRDTQGRIVAAPAQLSIAVIDPAIDGPAGYVARWDFAPTETAKLFQRGEMPGAAGPGIFVELPWPGEPPQHDELRVFARYVTEDGRKLVASQAIRLGASDDEPAERPDGRTIAADTPPSEPPAQPPPDSSVPGWRRARERGAGNWEGSSSWAGPTPRQPSTTAPAERVADATSAASAGASDQTPDAPPPKLTRPSWSPYR